MEQKFYTVLEVARRAHVNLSSVYAWIWLKKLPAYQPAGPGGKWFMKKEDVERFLEQRKSKASNTLPVDEGDFYNE